MFFNELTLENHSTIPWYYRVHYWIRITVKFSLLILIIWNLSTYLLVYNDDNNGSSISHRPDNINEPQDVSDCKCNL